MQIVCWHTCLLSLIFPYSFILSLYMQILYTDSPYYARTSILWKSFNQHQTWVDLVLAQLAWKMCKSTAGEESRLFSGKVVFFLKTPVPIMWSLCRSTKTFSSRYIFWSRSCAVTIPDSSCVHLWDDYRDIFMILWCCYFPPKHI